MTEAFELLLAIELSPEEYEVCSLEELPRPRRSECRRRSTKSATWGSCHDRSVRIALGDSTVV